MNTTRSEAVAEDFDHNQARRRDAEDAFERIYMDYAQGKATEADWEHCAWEMGILDHYKRLKAQAYEV